MVKKVWKQLLVLGLLVILAASVGSAAGKNQVELTFWDQNPGPQRTPYLQELLKRFENQNPSIKVKYVGIPSGSAAQKYNLAIAGGETPDVAIVPGSWISVLVSQKALLPLDGYFNKWADKDQLGEAYINQIRHGAPDNKLYVIPNTANAYCLWYRADRFKAANLTAPQTWDDFFAAVKKLIDKANNQYGLSIRGGAGSDTVVLAGIVAYSGITSFFNKKGKCLLNNPAAVIFIKKYAALYDKYTPQSDITNGYKEMVAAFDSGVANMIFHNLGSYGEHHRALKTGQFAAAPFPLPANGRRTYLADAPNGNAIFKNTKHPKEAWRLVSFFSSKDAQRFWNQKIGQIPTNVDLLTEKWVDDVQHISALGKAFAVKGTIIVSQPEYLPDYKNIRIQVFEPGFQAVLAGQKTAKQFLDELAAALEKSEKMYRATRKK
jgi:multiple sugar transport system substrate-binding protein